MALGLKYRMSIIVSVKINDGIVMAADSASTFSSSQVYEHANKIVNLVKGFHIGVMTCGAGNVGNASVATLLKDLRMRLSGDDTDHADWKLDRTNYTMEAVNSRVHEFFSEKAREADHKYFLMLRVCGYSSGRPLPEIWQVVFGDDGKPMDPVCVQKESDFVPQWNGELEALNRLIGGFATIPKEGLEVLGFTIEQMEKAIPLLVAHVYELLIYLLRHFKTPLTLHVSWWRRPKGLFASQ
jgi:hypothetical protein